MNSESIAVGLLVCAIMAAAAVAIWAVPAIIEAVRERRARRRACAAVYDDRGEDTEPVELPPPLPTQRSHVSVRTIPPAPLPTRQREPMRSAYTPPAAPADPGPVLFGDPVSLFSPSVEATPTPADDGFKGGGGGFGGAGASGGWDAPAAAPDPDGGSGNEAA